MILTNLFRLIAPTFARAGAILCYHGVDLPERSPTGLVNISSHQFWEHMECASEIATFVPLSEIVERHQRGLSTAGLVSLTFDDAYESVRSIIGPDLATADIPFAIFPVTSAADRGAPFWWDRLDTLAAALPDREWQQLEAECGLPGFDAGFGERSNPHWTLRQHIVGNLSGRVSPEIEHVLIEYERRLHVSTPQRAMAWSDLQWLQDHCSVEFGVHTVTHPVLPLLTESAAIREISDAHHILSDRLPATLPVVAAPFGLFDEHTAEQARAAGMDACLTLSNTTLGGPATSVAEIPRICMDRRSDSLRLALRVTGLSERIKRLRGTDEHYPFVPRPNFTPALH